MSVAQNVHLDLMLLHENSTNPTPNWNPIPSDPGIPPPLPFKCTPSPYPIPHHYALRYTNPLLLLPNMNHLTLIT